MGNRKLAVVFAAAVSLASCHKAPGGQVIATVDGQEVTRRDLLAELRALGGKSDADLNSVQTGLASALVDRSLLIAEAKREKLDKNPDYLAAQQRQQDVLLASMLAQTFAARVRKPDAGAVRQFVAQNPQMFAGRKLLAVSEVSAAAKGITPQEIAPLHGQAAVVAYLNAKKIPFGQRTVTLDTLSLPKALTDKLLSLPAGEPLAIGNGSSVVFTAVLNVREAPVPADQQAKVAESAMMQQEAGKQLQNELQQLRSAADIKYLPGFEPAKPAANAATPAS